MRKKVPTENEQIIESIRTAHTQLEYATNLFNEINDERAIDFASYNLMAAKTRYSYLIKLAKDKGLTI